jgi:hypothetical protein
VRINSNDVEVGKICKSERKGTAECDVLSRQGNAKITFIECKGYKPYSTVKHEDVKRWIGKQVPVFFDYAKREYPNAEINVELWTTGNSAMIPESLFVSFKKITQLTSVII